MVHDFAITERYLVFVLMPYRYLPLVPAPGSEAEERGWLVGTSYHWRQRRTTLSVYRG
jgi:carotenoid cleavage dioxygenase-like enzyme